ncbi:hypothetical protein [Streptomyces chartreusis]|uniref:hypothetical protein n=1 Tax=Streptomyces chartreusis TaxID=1969 RepID=UPI0036DA97DE
MFDREAYKQRNTVERCARQLAGRLQPAADVGRGRHVARLCRSRNPSCGTWISPAVFIRIEAELVTGRDLADGGSMYGPALSI